MPGARPSPRSTPASRKAFGTIIDAHLTALIAAIALFWLGSGPIRGFAVTLAIGIISTLFTAYLVTRLIVAIWVRLGTAQRRAALIGQPRMQAASASFPTTPTSPS